MKKKIENPVQISTGIKKRRVFVHIDCPDELTCGLYLAFIEQWIVDLAKAHPERTEIIEGRNGNA